MKRQVLVLSGCLLVSVAGVGCVFSEARLAKGAKETGGDLSSFTSSGPDVELINNMLESWRVGDIDKWRSYYAEDAKYQQNAWGKMAPIDELGAKHRAFLEQLKGKSTITNKICEVITTEDGEKRAHLWFEVEQEFKSGEVAKNVVFASYGINDAGKITYDWAIYDPAGLPADTPDSGNK